MKYSAIKKAYVYELLFYLIVQRNNKNRGEGMHSGMRVLMFYNIIIFNNMIKY